MSSSDPREGPQYRGARCRRQGRKAAKIAGLSDAVFYYRYRGPSPAGLPARIYVECALPGCFNTGVPKETAMNTTAAEPLLLRRDEDGIAFLTLNRPAQRNALSVALMDALQDALDAIAGDAKVKVVVIAGAGPGFCAGHDLKEMRANPGRQHYEALFAQCSRVMTSIVKLP